MQAFESLNECRISMGSLQSAILGFGIFRLLEKSCGIKGFSMEENVIVQTTAVATATMPLAAGGKLVSCRLRIIR